MATKDNRSDAAGVDFHNYSDDKPRKLDRDLRFENYYERGVLFAGFVLTIVTVFTGTFVGTNVLLSWVWVIPLMLVIACFIAKRFGFLLVPLVLFLGLLILAFVGRIFTMPVWAFFIGNETLNFPGVWNALGRLCIEYIPLLGVIIGLVVIAIGWLINMALAFAVPAWLVYQLTRRIFDRESSLGRTLGLTVLTLVSFIAPIGWAVIMNAGY